MRPAALLLMVWMIAASGASAADAPLSPGETFRDCPDCPLLVVVPPGRFVMGSDDGGKGFGPAHPAAVAEPFALGVTEVTFAQWLICVEAGGCARVPDDHGWGMGAMPIINVTYGEVQSYLDWLSRRTGHHYRLPSEVEWEHAARAGTATRYWWGEEPGEGRANCRKCGTPWSGKGSAPAASFAPNPWGLYDMHGNAWEWVADCWHPDHRAAAGAQGVRDARPRDGETCDSGTVRGGSWYYFPRLSASASRARNDRGVKSYNIGFRVLRELTEAEKAAIRPAPGPTR